MPFNVRNRRSLRREVSGGGPPRFYYKFDGVDDIAISPAVSIASSSPVSISFVAPSTYIGPNKTILFSSDASIQLFTIGSTGLVQIVGASSASIDGNPLAAGDQLPMDGQRHTIVINPSSSFTSSFWVGGHNVFGWRADFIIYDWRVGDGSFINIPIDDGPGVASLRNLGSGPALSANNFEDGNWQRGI